MKTKILILILIIISPVFPQDSVDVTFRYTPPPGVGTPYVPGEFNGWNPTAWPMSYIGGPWIRTARLLIGGNPSPPPNGIPNAWQYKFYYNGASPWPNDPLNHHQNSADNYNSFIYTRDPTIYHFLPNQRTGTVTTDYLTITAYLFPRVGTTLDTSTLSLTVDTTTYTGLGGFYNFTTKHFSFPVPTSLSDGGHTVILRADTSADTVNFVVLVGSPPALPMPSYARHGVTLPSPASNDSTTFRIRVGGANYVLIRIAPLGQPVTSAQPIFLRRDTGSDNWWLNISLPAGTYEYQYQTSSGAQINDPWGRYNGTYGSRFTIGPEGLTADDYVYQSNNYQRPPLNKLVIYELHVGEFAGGYYGLGGGEAGFGHLTTLLPYLDSLGINAIELMPINDYGLIGRSGHSWGYDISSYFALEPAYGTPRDFKVLVDSAHARGIAVIVDVVFNHLNDPSPLWQMQPDTGSPYFKLCSDLRYNEDTLCFFRDLDHWTPETQELIYEVLKMWIEIYRVDGFRYDFTQGIGWNIADTTNGILGWSNRIAQEYGGAIYQIAEHLPESPALVFYSGLTGGWHDSFRDEVFDEARFGNTSLLDFENLVLDLGAYSGNDIPSSPSVYANRTEPVNANVTHDEQSLIYEMTTFQGVPESVAVQRDKLYAAFMFASLGIPMLWEGMEFSAPRGWTTGNEKLSYRPVEWYLYPTARGQSHYQYYKALIFQRTHNPALYNGVLRKLYRYVTEKVLVWGFEDSTSGAKFMSVSNLSNAQRTVTNVPWLAPEDWYDVFDQSVFTVSGAAVPNFTVPAYTVKLYSNLSDSVLSSVRGTDGDILGEFTLAQNYPNPFNPSTKIKFSIPLNPPFAKGDKVGIVSLKVYDVLGREVAVLVNRIMQPGNYEVTWDAKGFASGVYFYRLTTADATLVKKMLLLR